MAIGGVVLTLLLGVFFATCRNKANKERVEMEENQAPKVVDEITEETGSMPLKPRARKAD